jgi:hypothetical protein
MRVNRNTLEMLALFETPERSHWHDHWADAGGTSNVTLVFIYSGNEFRLQSIRTRKI